MPSGSNFSMHGSGQRGKAQRFSRALLLALCLSATASQPAAGKSGNESWPHLEQVRTILKAPTEKQALVALIEIGPSATPALWAILSGQAQLEGDLPSSAARDLMHSSIEAWPAESVVQLLVPAIKSTTPLGERLVAMKLLALTESDAGFQGIFDLLAGLDAMQSRSNWVASALSKTMLPMLAAEPKRFKLLTQRLPEVDRNLLPAIMQTLADLPRPEVTAVLSQVAILEPSHERLVLTELAKHDFLLANRSRQRLVSLTRDHLTHREASMRRLAAIAIARLGDVESFVPLIDMLEDQHAGPRRAALEALQSLSGLERNWEAPEWLRWLDSEETWIGNTDGLRIELFGSDLYRSKAAARELAAHTFFAADVANLLRHCLSHTDAGIRLIGCQGLSKIKHPQAVEHLIPMLSDADDEVRAVALAALRQITSVDLGIEGRAWHQWWDSL